MALVVDELTEAQLQGAASFKVWLQINCRAQSPEPDFQIQSSPCSLSNYGFSTSYVALPRPDPMFIFQTLVLESSMRWLAKVSRQCKNLPWIGVKLSRTLPCTIWVFHTQEKSYFRNHFCISLLTAE